MQIYQIKGLLTACDDNYCLFLLRSKIGALYVE